MVQKVFQDFLQTKPNGWCRARSFPARARASRRAIHSCGRAGDASIYLQLRMCGRVRARVEGSRANLCFPLARSGALRGCVARVRVPSRAGSLERGHSRSKARVLPRGELQRAQGYSRSRVESNRVVTAAGASVLLCSSAASNARAREREGFPQRPKGRQRLPDFIAAQVFGPTTPSGIPSLYLR